MLDGRDLEYRERSSHTCCKKGLLVNRFPKCQFPCQLSGEECETSTCLRDLYSSFSQEELDNALQSILRDFSELRLQESFGTTQKQRSVDFDNGEG